MASVTAPVQIPLNACLKLRTDLRITPQELGQGPCYLVEDPFRLKFYRIGVREFTFVSLLDGKTSLGQALGQAATVLGVEALSADEALAIGDWLIGCQLVDDAHLKAGDREPSSASRTGTAKTGNWLRQVWSTPFFIKMPFVNPNRLLDVALPRSAWLLGPRFLAIWVIIVTSGVCCAVWHRQDLLAPSFVLLDPGNWARLLLAWCCLTVWHETFHALACKKYGGTVPRAGVAFLMFIPAAFVDVTSSWRFSSKWQRIATAAAGMYAELFIASVAILVWSQTEDGVSHRFCYDLALMASLGTLLFNGNPLLRFDGYYMMSDLLDIPNLAPLSHQYLAYLLRRYVAGFSILPPALPPRRAVLVKSYALASACWRWLLLMSIFLWVIGTFPYLGTLVVVVVSFFYLFLPTVQDWTRLARSGAAVSRSVRQWAVVGGCVAGAASMTGIWLFGRSTVYAPAAVEYAPLTIVRSLSPGFVREVPVRSGDRVRAGQILVRLENEDLRAELVDIELVTNQSLIQGRIHHQNGEIAKSQIEATKRQALEKRKVELQRQVEALEVRAPVDGHLIGRRLESLIGQYLEAGKEITEIGNEDTKELVVAIVQDDIDVFAAHLGQAVEVRVWGAAIGKFPAMLQKVDPECAARQPAHDLVFPGGRPFAREGSPFGGSGG